MNFKNAYPRSSRWRIRGLLFSLIAFAISAPLQASVVEFTGGPTTTAADSEVYFSPLSGQVWTSYSDNALFGIGNVSGDLAIAFNTTGDGAFVVAPNPSDAPLSTVARLSAGAVIGPASAFDNTEYTLAESDGAIGNWNGLGTGFFGFQFGTGDDIHYGWANITVLPDYNVTLNSFAYDTVAGQAITTATAVPEPSSGLLGGSACLILTLFLWESRFRGLTGKAALLTTVAIGSSTILTAQTSGRDPIGSNLVQVRSDHLFSVIPSPAPTGTAQLKTFSTTFGDNISLNDTQYSTSVAWTQGRQYHSASGRILQPDHDDVVMAYVDGTNIDVQILGHPEVNVTIPDVHPRYAWTANPAGTPATGADFIAVTVGDLDHAGDSIGNYHDEVVIAYVGSNNKVEVALLDYGNSAVYPAGYPNGGQITYQAPRLVNYATDLAFSPDSFVNYESFHTSFGILPEDNFLSVSLGSYDGDGAKEIALGFVKNYSNVTIETLRYRKELGGLLEIGQVDLGTVPINGNLALTAANLSLASGDYYGNGTDGLATGFLEYVELQNEQPSSTLFDGYGVDGHFAVNVLNSSMLTQRMNVTVRPGNPTQVTLSASSGQLLLGQIPHQLTIAGAPCDNSNPWCSLNGSWSTTLSTLDDLGVMSFSIPLDSSSITVSAPQTLTLLLTSALAPPQGSSPFLLSPSGLAGLPSYFDFRTPDNYPRIQLVSGVFRPDPTTSSLLTRKQLAGVWNSPQYCTWASTGETCSTESGWLSQYQLSIGHFAISPDSNNIPQITQYGSDTFAAPQPGARAAQRFEVTAGGFRENATITGDTPAVWSLAINAWFDNAQDYLYLQESYPLPGTDAIHDLVGIQSFGIGIPPDGQSRLALVNYDPDGESPYLGAPVHLTAQITSPIRILEEPPKQTAWLNGKLVNLSRNDGFFTSLTTSTETAMTSSTTASANSTFSKSEAVTAGLTASYNAFDASASFSVDDTAKFNQSYTNIASNFDRDASSKTFTDTLQAVADDYIDFQTQNLDVWRFRVYGPQGESVGPGTYPYYELTFPSAFETDSSPGVLVDWYNPVHENGNLLSYPALPASGRPDDVSPTAYTVNGQIAPGVSDGLISPAKGYCISSGIKGSEQIEMTGVQDADSKVEWNKTNSWDNDTKISGTVGIGAVAWGLDLNLSLDLDFSQNQSWSETASSENTLTGSQSILFQQDQSTEPYNVYPVVYNSTAGVFKFIYYVGLDVAGGSQTCETNYWTQTYGGAPDPALNLPDRFKWTEYNGNKDTTTWAVEQTLDREQLRGFTVNKKSNLGNTIPIGSNPHEGDIVWLSVPVYNYSVGPSNTAQSVVVNFSAAPYDGEHGNETACVGASGQTSGIFCPPASRIQLGSVIIPTIPAWGQGQNWQTATLQWSIPAGFSAQHNGSEFRIYVDIAKYPDELNPPQTFCTNTPANQACPRISES